MKFYLKHYRGGGKASIGFDQDRIKILLSMATDTCSSHRVIMDVIIERFGSDPFS